MSLEQNTQANTTNTTNTDTHNQLNTIIVKETNLDDTFEDMIENKPEYDNLSIIINNDINNNNTNNNKNTNKTNNKSKNSIKDLNTLDVFDTIQLEAQDYARNFHLTPNNIILLITKIVEIVNKVKGLSLDDKINYTEEICLDILENNTSLSDNDKQYIRLMLNTFINFVFELSNKKLVLKVKKNKNLRNKPMIELVDSILNKIIRIIKNKKYDFESLVANIPVLIGMIITFTSAIPDLTGLEKKNIVILVITKLLDDNINGLFQLNDKQKETINFIKQTLPETIDIIIGVSKGKFDLKEQLSRIILCCLKRN